MTEANLTPFLEHLHERDAALPRFATDQFKDYLRCGRLEHGFIRVKCDGCRSEHLVALSCKRPGFCTSCGARRMIETSAHLIDHVLPPVTNRQWVLAFPWPCEYCCRRDPRPSLECSRSSGAIETALIRHAGLTRKNGACGGIVTLIQRFGSSLNPNVHLHVLVLDGVYANENGKPRFRPLPAPAMMTQLLDVIVVPSSAMACWFETRNNPGSIWRRAMRWMHWVLRRSSIGSRSAHTPAVRC